MGAADSPGDKWREIQDPDLIGKMHKNNKQKRKKTANPASGVEATKCHECGGQAAHFKAQARHFECWECQRSASEGELCENCRSFQCTKCTSEGIANASLPSWDSWDEDSKSTGTGSIYQMVNGHM